MGIVGNSIFFLELSGILAATVTASHSSGQALYDGAYLMGVSLSFTGEDPNPETGAIRVKVKQTYNFRRDIAGFGNSGCMERDMGKKSSKLAPTWTGETLFWATDKEGFKYFL